MTKVMLIDAAHVEETRVVVINSDIIEEFEYQNTYKKSIKGNIYLAKVIRVEPSLQAAFVDYGAGRHGFLSLAEIHPSYYQIPLADKEALMKSLLQNDKPVVFDENHKFEQFDLDEESEEELESKENFKESPVSDDENDDTNLRDTNDSEELHSKIAEKYRIQEVIKKDQVILIQVVKEERGNKGASMTTYISLAGRYCVLMPNSFRDSGVSRKIFDHEERNRLKNVAEELNEKSGRTASVIIRTAGAYKTKTEMKRDFNYLVRLWNNIREHTLASKAPAFIHEEGDVIKKSIRDIYTSDIEQIFVSGDEAHNNALKFMELIMPRHVKKVKKHKGKAPLFTKYNIENQLSALYDPIVLLKSGGHIVINHTEALVAIDVNSGKATSERNVENTAIKTNLEAAREIARQMRLRDLSGLLVIDFIDMGDVKNRKTVERVFKDALSNDRARIQMNRISMFGLLEMTRQRLRQSFFESNTHVCPNCEGRGRTRPVEATGVAVLRAIDNEISQGALEEIRVSGSSKLMFYLLNNKREEISHIEKSFKIKVNFYIDEEAGSDGFFIEKVKKNKEEDSATSALSAIDFEPYMVAQEHVAVQNTQDSEDKTQRRKWKNSNRDKRNNNNENSRPQKSHAIEYADSEVRSEEKLMKNQPSSRSRDINNESKNSKMDGDNRRSKHRNNQRRIKDKRNDVNIVKPEIYDIEEENNFEKNMEQKRQQNQSFLKEIWKKIVQ